MSHSNSDEESDVVDESGEDESDEEESDEEEEAGNSDVIMSEGDEEEFVGRAADLDVLSPRQQSSRECNLRDPGLMGLEAVAIQAACARLCEADGPRCKKSLAGEEWDVTPEIRQGAMDCLAARKEVVEILERVVNAIVQRDEGSRVPQDALATGRVTLHWLLEKFDAELERVRKARRARGGGAARGAGHAMVSKLDGVQKLLEDNSDKVLALRQMIDDGKELREDDGEDMPTDMRTRFGMPPTRGLSYEHSRCPCCCLLFSDTSSAESCREGLEILPCGHMLHVACRERWLFTQAVARYDIDVAAADGGIDALVAALPSNTDMDAFEFSCPTCRQPSTTKDVLPLSTVAMNGIMCGDHLLLPITRHYFGRWHYKRELACILNPEEKGTEAHWSNLLFRLITSKGKETRRAALYATALLWRGVTTTTVALGPGPTAELKELTHKCIQKIEHSRRLRSEKREVAAAARKEKVETKKETDQMVQAILQNLAKKKKEKKEKKKRKSEGALSSAPSKKKAKKKKKQTDASTEAGGSAVGAQ